MDGEQPADVLEELLAVKGKHLLHTAVLLAGSQEDGEDLLQAALERVFGRWRTIRGNPEGYLRRTLYHLAADRWRRKEAWRARLSLLGRLGAQPDDTGAVDNRDQLLRLLRQLPPRQRTAIVLRYWEELTEAQSGTRPDRKPVTDSSRVLLRPRKEALDMLGRRVRRHAAPRAEGQPYGRLAAVADPGGAVFRLVAASGLMSGASSSARTARSGPACRSAVSRRRRQPRRAGC